ncbi:MAG: hypothetical protein KF696_01770 [Planctomycetes bacterium]|nr:hypothetical protein [Planctomycetota bacterium]MCW8134728.1 hypothetical protein [Planctomycetota bacterium]
MPHFYLGSLARFYARIGGVGDLQRETDPEVISGAVSAWRHWLNKELPHPLDWDESPTAPFDDAAVGDSDWQALCRAAGQPEQLVKPSLWLPGDHDFLFEVRDLREELVCVGASNELAKSLAGLPEMPGLAVLRTLARRSVEYRLPLIARFDL